MAKNSTETNSTETEKVKSVALEGAKKRFESRDKPAAEKEIKAAFVAYFKTDDEIKQLQDKVAELTAKRTEQTKDLVALRGPTQINIAGRGVGRFSARGESAWITFPGEAGPALSLA
jgi:3-methyladenine DNA glycosylase/8-oxoguanine DNA glycosylase